MKKRKAVIFQRRIPGQFRIPSSSSLEKELRKKVELDARRFNLSMSKVIADALKEFYGLMD